MGTQQSNPAGHDHTPTFWSKFEGLISGGKPITKRDWSKGEQFFPGDVPDAANCVDDAGRPIFDVSNQAATDVSEKEMSDKDKLAWKNYQLWRATLKVDRRDTVFEALASGDIPQYRMSQHWMGTPFPVIEPHPYIGEIFSAMRWYEHALSGATALFYYSWIKAKPNVRYTGNAYTTHKVIFMFTWFMMEFNFGYRSAWRLQGQVHNEAECYKYGIVETPDRLKQKAIYWKKFRDYKEEWMKRWDYYVWGIRPGERYSFWSACFVPPWPVRFNTKTDFPVRKNPFMLTTMSLKDMRLDSMLQYQYVPNADTPLERTRPEVKYVWRGGVA